MNVRKMRQIGKDILAKPRRFNMLGWFLKITNRTQAMAEDHAVGAIPPCGTAACYAGHWAMRYAGVSLEMSEKMLARSPAPSYLPDSEGRGLGEYIPDACADDLDLPNQRLLHSNEWPARLKTKLKAGTRRYAEHFVNNVLEDYIKTDGWKGEAEQ